MTDLLFLLKKFVGAWIMPLPLSLLMILLGLWMLRRQWRVMGRSSLMIGLMIILLCSNGIFVRQLIAPLESQYSTYSDQPVDYILVLGNAHRSFAGIPVTSVLEGDSMYRLAEGLRIARINPEATIILSGFAFSDQISNAEAYRRVAVALGVDEARIRLMEEARDTGEELATAAGMVGGKSVALVTSAYHMPRSMGLANHHHLTVVAAPAAHKYKAGLRHWLLDFIPSASAVQLSHMAIHEYLGILWYRITGRLS